MRTELMIIAALAVAAPARADTRLWFASLNFETTTLVVPAIGVRSTDDRGHEWNAWLTGWTVGADWSVARTPRRRWRVVARVTPVNAHSSNYIYVDGQRDLAASFSAASIDAAAGAEVVHSPRWTGHYRGLFLYDRIRGVPARLREAWNHPFAGIATVQRYSRVRSETRFGSRWEGWKAEAAAEIYSGGHTWSRLRASAGGGHRRGPVFLSAGAAAISGQSLDTVSAFLIGGSWNLAVPDLLVGYRYAEFRVNRAATAAGGVDLRLRGALEVGVRGAVMKAPGLAARGAALQITTLWNGALFEAGVARPYTPGGQGPRRPVLFATVTAALVGR